MSWLGNVNYYVFQWFFFRLAKEIDPQTKKTKRWLLIFVWPRTGWENDYRYWWKPSWRK